MTTKTINVLPADVKPGDRITVTGIVGSLDHRGHAWTDFTGSTEPTRIDLDELAQAVSITREATTTIEPGCMARSVMTGVDYRVWAVVDGWALARDESSPAYIPVSVRVSHLERI